MRSSIEREVAAREEMIQFLLRANRPDPISSSCS
jgi:hypothetical protein